ncbi:MAG: glycosyltransferase family 4 protein [Candidatus Omnitrophica bacterium]|nr:glycosyltransferase family 4 protein [Candidatus Omnitrophota bacterium]
MNILYLTTHLNVGGITSYLLTLTKGMLKRGHNVYLASSGGKVLDRFLKEGIVHMTIPIRTKADLSPRILLSLIKLKKYIQKNNIQIIHSHTRVTQVLGELIQYALRKPYLSTCHGFFKLRLIRRILPCWGMRVIAISEAVKEHLIKDLKVDPEKIRVIYNGIDLENLCLFKPEERIKIKERFSLKDAPLVGIIARLSEVKGHIYLIKAMKKVLSYLADVKLVIVGEGRLRQRLTCLVKELEIEKNVVFLPYITDTRQLLSVTDLFVMPSLEEGLGLSLMEAMASGVAVVASDVGGIRNLIQHNYNGILVKPRDIEGLAKAIIEVLLDKQKKEYLGRNARLFINQHFSQEKMVLETEQVYLECLEESL